MKRKGETLAEFLVSAMVFGLMMAGVSEFISVQTQNTVHIKDRDDLMFGAQAVYNYNISRDVTVSGGTAHVREHTILHNIDHGIKAGENATYFYGNRDTGGDPEFSMLAIDSPVRVIEHDIISFDWDKDNYTLTVKKEKGVYMSVPLRPLNDP